MKLLQICFLRRLWSRMGRRKFNRNSIKLGAQFDQFRVIRIHDDAKRGKSHKRQDEFQQHDQTFSVATC